ncbi:MAG: metal ABC transporter permease [Bacilli bacterium]|nr:metal ABC transporter permease [Bacilli bacterium]
MINAVNILNPFMGFSYDFFIKAFVCIILLSLILPFIGIRLSSKGFSMVADTLSHTSLAGIAIGLAVGGMPLIYSIIFSVVCSLLIEFFRRKFPKLAEISLAIILCFALGLTGILTKFAPGNRFESYLFGSLFTVNNVEFIALIFVVIFAIVYEVLFYRSNLALSFNEDECKANGLNVILLSSIDTIVTSLVIAVACNIVGSLLITCFISVPVALALKLAKSNKGAMLIASLASIVSGIIGLFIGYAFSLHIGGSIVLTSVFFLIIAFLANFIANKRRGRRAAS